MSCSDMTKESWVPGKHTSFYLKILKASTKAEIFYIWSNENLATLT